MGEHVTLYSSYPISFEELSTAILATGGEPISPEKRHGLDLLGRLEDKGHHIYIYGDAEPGDPIQFWKQEMYYLGENLMKEVTAKLGGKPVVSFAMRFGYTARSEFLAVELAYQCAKRWPCVVLAETLEDSKWKNIVYTKENMERLLGQRKAFTTYYGTLIEGKDDADE